MASEKSPKHGVVRVASDAGVSIATVSRAFNDPGLVREDVRNRIIKAAAAIGYIPNSAAKALRLQRTRLVGAVIPSLDHAIYSKLVNSFQQQLAETGYTVVVLTVGFDSAAVFPGIRQIVERGAEALMIVGKVEDKELRNFLSIRGMPWVQTYSIASEPADPAIGFDNFAAMREVIEHLLALGHRDLAMISGVLLGNDRQQARASAFRSTLQQAGLGADMPVIATPYSLQNGVNAMRHILERYPQTTAVACSSDILAFGALHACKEAGKSVPRDISVSGFDDLEFATLTEPSLTTVAIGADEMGRLAGERIAAALEARLPIEGQCLPTKLLVRGSTGPSPRCGGAASIG